MKSLNWVALGLFVGMSMFAQTQMASAKDTNLQPARVAAACKASAHCASFPGTDGGFGGCFTSGKGLCFSCTKSSCWIDMQAAPPSVAGTKIKAATNHVAVETPVTSLTNSFAVSEAAAGHIGNLQGSSGAMTARSSASIMTQQVQLH